MTRWQLMVLAFKYWPEFAALADKHEVDVAEIVKDFAPLLLKIAHDVLPDPSPAEVHTAVLNELTPAQREEIDRMNRMSRERDHMTGGP